MNINKAILVGRVCHTPEMTTTKTGQTVAKCSLATNSSWKDKNTGEKIEKTQFHNIIMWGKLAEIFAQYVIKGQEIYIEGQIETRKYEGKDGTTKYVTEIIASQMQMGQKPSGAGANKYPDESTAPMANQPASPAQAAVPVEPVNEVTGINPDDIPF